MKFILLIFCLLFVSLFSLGCGTGGSNSDTPPSIISGRLDAAMGMDKGMARDEALAKVAVDAAKEGDGKITIKAINLSRNGVAFEKLCATCSLALAEAGNTSDATKIAKMITSNDSLRNLVLGKIAQGNQSQNVKQQDANGNLKQKNPKQSDQSKATENEGKK